jgi:1,4-alpha-glucan branching enzyme
MNPTQDELNDATETITFYYCSATRPAKVCLIGDFNNWSATRHPMQRQADG